MTLVAKSDQSTGNSLYASYVIRSNDLVFAFTAPYSRKAAAVAPSTNVPLPGYSQQVAFDFVAAHGLAVRAVGIAVADAAHAYEVSVKNGGISVLPPLTLHDGATGTQQVWLQSLLLPLMSLLLPVLFGLCCFYCCCCCRRLCADS